MDFKKLNELQRQYFASGETLPISFRLKQLALLKSAVKQHQNMIIKALYLDLHKPETEALITEILLVLDDIDLHIKNLKKWARNRGVKTPFPLLWPGKSTLYHEPYGLSLIIGPWNFPFLLTMQPLIGAISAGNCAVIKPSELAPHTEQVILNIINQYFNEQYICAVHADIEGTQTLLTEKWDYIFFTGSERVGKIIMTAAAQYLTPVTLELGGKSPCIVDDTANIKHAARHIAWAKTMNAGQVCVAPDYVYVHRTVKPALINELKKMLHHFYGDDPKQSRDYARIIHDQQIKKLKKLLENSFIVHGGEIDEKEKFVAPTLIDNVSWNDAIMQEEIFGPLLPILTFDHIDEVIHEISVRAKPLALYLFTKNKMLEEKILQRVSFGAGSINTCALHLANPHLPFGGVGTSGMGQYHGRYSFETFSHKKGVYKKNPLIDIKLHHPPHSGWKQWLLKKLFF